MKKLLALLIGFIALAAHVNAEELSSQARRFKNSVKIFLLEEGYTVEESSAGSGWIFRNKNTTYLIVFDKENPVFVKIERLIDDPGSTNTCDILSALNSLNSNYCCIKGVYNAQEHDVVLAIEAYYHSTEEFRHTFKQNMTVLDTCYFLYDELIGKPSGSSGNSVSSGTNASAATSSSASTASTDPVELESVSVANCDADNKIINDFGSTIFAYRTRYLEPKLSLKVNKAGTYNIGVKLYAADGSLSTGTSSREGYSYVDTKTLAAGSRDIILSGWGKDVNGNWPAGKYRFVFYLDDKYLGEKTFTIR